MLQFIFIFLTCHLKFSPSITTKGGCVLEAFQRNFVTISSTFGPLQQLHVTKMYFV